MNKMKKLINDRNIKEIVHFTTNVGLLGILRTGAVLPNSQLKEENTLAFIFQQNSLKRKEWDSRWLNYVNLSVTKINLEFFEHSKGVHRTKDIFWAILAFSVEIIFDEGVYFTTTNNIYPSNLRGLGLEGFQTMFNDSIEGKFQKRIIRTPSHLPSWTTCEQAEVLYPGRLDLNHLVKVYVSCYEDKASIMGQLAVLDLVLDVEVCPNKFRDEANDN